MYINAWMANKLNETVCLVSMKLSYSPPELGRRSCSLFRSYCSLAQCMIHISFIHTNVFIDLLWLFGYKTGQLYQANEFLFLM